MRGFTSFGKRRCDDARGRRRQWWPTRRVVNCEKIAVGRWHDKIFALKVVDKRRAEYGLICMRGKRLAAKVVVRESFPVELGADANTI